MNHTLLKSKIKIAQATTRIQRSEANKLIQQARKLRKQARAEADVTKKDRLASRVQTCFSRSLELRFIANAGQQDRRSMHLAAALLNGKSYKQCEHNPKNPPTDKSISEYIAVHLTADERKHAAHIAEVWIRDGGIRLSYIKDSGLARIIDQDKKRLEIGALKLKIRYAEGDHEHARIQMAQAERNAKNCKAYLEQKTSTLWDLQERLKVLLQVTSIDDPLSEVA